MADNNSEQEPSIEEILASIRQIISDDDEEETVEEKPVEDPVKHESDDVLELTEDDLVEEEPVEEIVLQDSAPEPEPEPEPLPEPEPVIEKKPVPSEILSSGTQAAAMDSIHKLKTKMPINSSTSYDGVTLEDIVREMLHPMLREWMDENLPHMVERIVQKEMEKLARRALDD